MLAKHIFLHYIAEARIVNKVRGKTAIWNQFFVGLYFVVLVIKCRVTLLCIAYNHHFEKAVKANQIKVFEALKEEGSTGEEGE